MEDDLEILWGNILSRDAERILIAWQELVREEQVAVYIHLQVMATEEGWSEPQRISAQAALHALHEAGQAPDIH